MKLIILKDYKDVGTKAAELVSKDIIKNKNLVLGLATGETMIPFYRSLVSLINNKKVDASEIKTFNLDEYVVFDKKNKNGYYYFMNKHLFSKIRIPAENINFLNGNVKNLDLECRNYENSIKKNGGIDLQILGIGRDGHIGFNEPGSSSKSRTREVLLSRITRKDNSRFFDGKISKVPKKALTVGIGTIMKSKKIILLASGVSKAKIVHRFLHGSIDKNIPASFLKKHRNITVILDKEAASELD